MESFECDALVIGAGVIGLAVGRHLAMAGLETVILEKNRDIGMETSARNSEVIHAGLYYPKDSLKEKLCFRGRELLYAFCNSHGVDHRRLGKLLVATGGDESVRLAKIARAAAENMETELVPLTKAQLRAMEPDLNAQEGLFSPLSGIIDSRGYILALLADAESAGASLARNAQVTAIDHNGKGYIVTINNAGTFSTLHTPILINSAGLWAQKTARLIAALDPGFVPPLHLAKGCYASFLGKSPFRHLIYPVPEPGGLGVHLTLDLAGQARFGPDVEWLETNEPAMIDYAVPPSLPQKFTPRIARYWPAVTESMLAPGYSGVRPKIAEEKNEPQDFRIDGPGVHGLPGLVNLFGIESPGLTSSLAIAEHVTSLVL